MGNKAWDYYCAYIDPDEIASKTPAKRLYAVAGPYRATGVSRAISQFWKEMKDEYEWGKRDVVLLGCQPAGLTPEMRKEEDEMGEDDHLDDVEVEAMEELDDEEETDDLDEEEDED